MATALITNVGHSKLAALGRSQEQGIGEDVLLGLNVQVQVLHPLSGFSGRVYGRTKSSYSQTGIHSHTWLLGSKTTKLTDEEGAWLPEPSRGSLEQTTPAANEAVPLQPRKASLFLGRYWASYLLLTYSLPLSLSKSVLKD